MPLLWKILRRSNSAETACCRWKIRPCLLLHVQLHSSNPSGHRGVRSAPAAE